MSELTTEQSSREQEREALRDARYFVELYARRNPRFEHDGEMQDPSGVNACLERIDAVLARPTMLLQDENSGREGRRYNEWHASRPDAKLNAREAAAALASPPPQPEPTSKGIAKMTQAEFIEWFGKNYYGEVVFGDPEWHAKSIYRRLIREQK